jgi:ketosteroid isomerase-like protein
MGAQNLTNEEVVRKWYAAWEKEDWGPVDSLLADNFTFTSAAGDDHISKSTFQNPMLGKTDRFHWTF